MKFSARFLGGRYAPLITHLSLATLTVLLIALVLVAPLWLALLLGAFLQYRIGILLHEYIHGIPWRKVKHNHAVLMFFDGFMLCFGLIEVFRGTHLSHHRWLNTERDPAFHSSSTFNEKRTLVQSFMQSELIQHVRYMADALRGNSSVHSRNRILFGIAASFVWFGFWVAVHRPLVAVMLVGLSMYNAAVPSSLRGAVEHHGPPASGRAVNEYRPLLPLFNINRHIHHHLDPRCPWYLLGYKTEKPLPALAALTYWFHVYVTRRYAMLEPPASKASGLTTAG